MDHAHTEHHRMAWQPGTALTPQPVANSTLGKDIGTFSLAQADELFTIANPCPMVGGRVPNGTEGRCCGVATAEKSCGNVSPCLR